jgi:transporter family-2 protein
MGVGRLGLDGGVPVNHPDNDPDENVSGQPAATGFERELSEGVRVAEHGIAEEERRQATGGVPSLHGSPRRVALVISVIVALIGGTMMTVQSRINGQLAVKLDDGFTAALVSFGLGLVIIAVVAAVSPGTRRGIREIPGAIRRGEIRWWYLLAGMGGGVYVLSQGLVVGVIGVALFTVAAVAGQTLAGLVIDARGIGRTPPKPVTVARIVGTLVVIAAVALSVAPQVNASAPWLLLAMPLVAGALSGWQQALNAQVRLAAHSPVSSTLVSFLAGTVLLGVVAGAHLAIAGPPHVLPTAPWLYLGGVLGVVFILINAVIVPIVGVLLQGLAAVCGQLLAALAIEALFPAPGTELTSITVIGTLLTLVGLVISVIPRRGVHRVSR